MTVKEVFETFEEPYRSRALENLDQDKADRTYHFHEFSINMIDLRAFFKRDIPQRWKYWEDFCTYLNVKSIVYRYAAN